MEKTVSQSRTEQVYVIRSQHINPSRRLFGGFLMQWIDEVAGVVCRRHSNGPVTAVNIDNLQFKKGAFEDEMVVLIGELTYIGSTSMEVCVESYVESYTGERNLINKAYVVMVAIDPDGRPRKVPGLVLQTEEQKEEWKNGERRYALRKQRRAEGF